MVGATSRDCFSSSFYRWAYMPIRRPPVAMKGASIWRHDVQRCYAYKVDFICNTLAKWRSHDFRLAPSANKRIRRILTYNVTCTQETPAVISCHVVTGDRGCYVDNSVFSVVCCVIPIMRAPSVKIIHAYNRDFRLCGQKLFLFLSNLLLHRKLSLTHARPRIIIHSSVCCNIRLSL